MGASSNNKPISGYENSWAHEEFMRTHRVITQMNYRTGRREVTGYEKIHLPLHPDFGKPAVIIPGIENAITIDRYD